jgi:hypothetical protein
LSTPPFCRYSDIPIFRHIDRRQNVTTKRRYVVTTTKKRGGGEKIFPMKLVGCAKKSKKMQKKLAEIFFITRLANAFLRGH